MIGLDCIPHAHTVHHTPSHIVGLPHPRHAPHRKPPTLCMRPDLLDIGVDPFGIPEVTVTASPDPVYDLKAAPLIIWGMGPPESIRQLMEPPVPTYTPTPRHGPSARPVSVPEPPTWAILLVGLALLWLARPTDGDRR